MYRDEQTAAGLLLSAHPLRGHPPELVRLLAHRRSRIAAGCAGVAGAGITCITAVACFVLGRDADLVSAVLLGCWPAALLVWLVTFVLTHDLRVGVPERRARRIAVVEVKQRQHDVEGKQLRASVKRIGEASCYWPMWLFCLLTPMTTHVLAILILVARPVLHSGEWIQVSLAVTWLPHLVLCGLARRHVRDLNRDARRARQSWGRHLVLAGLSVLPSAFLFVLFSSSPHYVDLLLVLGIGLFAMVVILFTGLLFLPAVYGWAWKVSQREREILDSLAQDVLT